MSAQILERRPAASGAAAETPRRRESGAVRWLRALPFFGPHLVLFLVFGLVPTGFGIYTAFTRWDLIGSPEFVGLENFRVLFDREHPFHGLFMNGLANTMIFVVISVPLLIAVPMLLAVLLSRKGLRGASVFQAIFYVPGLISVAAGALAYSMLFNRELGPVNNILGTDISFMTTQPWAWVAIIVLTVWAGIGGNLIIYRAAISSIPEERFEAAAIDGAGPWRTFFHVTLPSMQFPLLFTTVMTTTGSFNVFGQPLMLTRGGPSESTTVLMMEVRDLAFGDGPSIVGIASAMAVLLGILLMAISAVQFVIMQRRNDE